MSGEGRRDVDTRLERHGDTLAIFFVLGGDDGDEMSKLSQCINKDEEGNRPDGFDKETERFSSCRKIEGSKEGNRVFQSAEIVKQD